MSKTIWVVSETVFPYYGDTGHTCCIKAFPTEDRAKEYWKGLGDGDGCSHPDPATAILYDYEPVELEVE